MKIKRYMKVVTQKNAGFLENKAYKGKDSFLQCSSGQGRTGQQQYNYHVKLFCLGSLAHWAGTHGERTRKLFCLLANKLKANDITEMELLYLVKTDEPQDC